MREHPLMRTLGIDLASQDKKTAWCVIEWRDGRATVQELGVDLDDGHAVDLINEADWAGIDAPFGWPNAAMAAISAHHAGKLWPDPTPQDLDLRFRATDLFVREKASIWPLSVSSDRIAVPAWRCARILARTRARDAQARKLAPDRLGADQIVEIYPAAALECWGFANRKGYKSSGNAARKAKAREVRVALVAELEEKTGDWLNLDAEARKTCEDNDDALDALLASLVTRAAANKQTYPAAERSERAAREGWIHLPRKGTLANLGLEG
jgi:predicted nuclease with RNAse H fold